MYRPLSVYLFRDVWVGCRKRETWRVRASVSPTPSLHSPRGATAETGAKKYEHRDTLVSQESKRLLRIFGSGFVQQLVKLCEARFEKNVQGVFCLLRTARES